LPGDHWLAIHSTSTLPTTTAMPSGPSSNTWTIISLVADSPSCTALSHRRDNRVLLQTRLLNSNVYVACLELGNEWPPDREELRCKTTRYTWNSPTEGMGEARESPVANAKVLLVFARAPAATAGRTLVFDKEAHAQPR